MQISAVKAPVCGTEPPVEFGSERDLAEDLAVAPASPDRGLRANGRPGEALDDTPRVEESRRVRRHLNTRADRPERRRLFEHENLVAGPAERNRGGEATHPGSDDHTAKRLTTHHALQASSPAATRTTLHTLAMWTGVGPRPDVDHAYRAGPERPGGGVRRHAVTGYRAPRMIARRRLGEPAGACAPAELPRLASAGDRGQPRILPDTALTT